MMGKKCLTSRGRGGVFNGLEMSFGHRNGGHTRKNTSKMRECNRPRFDLLAMPSWPSRHSTNTANDERREVGGPEEATCSGKRDGDFYEQKVLVKHEVVRGRGQRNIVS